MNTRSAVHRCGVPDVARWVRYSLASCRTSLGWVAASIAGPSVGSHSAIVVLSSGRGPLPGRSEKEPGAAPTRLTPAGHWHCRTLRGSEQAPDGSTLPLRSNRPPLRQDRIPLPAHHFFVEVLLIAAARDRQARERPPELSFKKILVLHWFPSRGRHRGSCPG